MSTKEIKQWLWLISVSLLLTFLLTPPAVYACEPCAEILGLEETAAQADLIIIGQKIAEGPHTGVGGPDWIMVKVIEILKGQVENEQIQVNSWDGMCAYGIVVDDNEAYVMFLEKGSDQYDTVEFGCAVTTLPIKGEGVELEGQVVPIDDLMAKLEPGAARVKVSSETAQAGESPNSESLPIWASLLILVIVALLSLRIKSKRPLT